MEILDYPIYEKMENLKKLLEDKGHKNHDKFVIEDIQYAGTINWIDVDHITQVKIPCEKNVYISVESHFNDEKVTKYFDEQNNLIAIDFHDDDGIMSTEKSFDFSYLKISDGKDFYSQFNAIKSRKNSSLKDFEKNIQSLSKETNLSKEELLVILREKNLELENISKKADISKEEIEEISSLDLKVSISEKENKIEVNGDTKKAHKKNISNQNSKDNPNIRQETDLNQKVNNKFTLGDILGVPQGEKLVVVYSSAVKNNKSTTKFTFLIKDKDGNFSPCENLELVAGNHPNNDVYASNYEGSVKSGHVNSEYIIKSPNSNERYVMTATIGAYGSVDLGLGQAPKIQGLNNSDTNLVTIPLKTTSTYNTKPITKETLLSYHADRYAADKRNNEAQMHEDKFCKENDTLTMYDVDGDKKTGKQYLTYEDMIETIKQLKLLDEKSEEYASEKGLLADIIKFNLHGNPHPTQQEFIEACNKCRDEHPRINSSRR